MNKFIFIGLALAVLTGTAQAHGTKKHADKAKKTFVAANLDKVSNAFGQTGDPKAVSRTITVTMSDEMRFDPAVMHIKTGETIRFVVKNVGEGLHELVIGSTADLKKHAVLMEKFPNMEHSEPFMAHAEEGQTAEIVWTFSKAGTFEYGCLIPGHYDAGMKGLIHVQGSEVVPVKGKSEAHRHDHMHNASGDNTDNMHN